jgi:hypothetical protein
MCILCKNKKTKIPTVDLTAVQQTSVDRKGLSNVYNINNDLIYTDEVFLSPAYNVSGATKPVSGITTTNCSGPFTGNTYSVSGCTFVYNLSEIDDINLVFDITGNTQYTGYTGDFCYYTFDLGLLPKDRDFVTKRDAIMGDCFDYVSITGNTINEIIYKGELPIKDAQYLLKDYNIFTTNSFTQNLKINTFDLTTQPTQSIFDEGWYFVTVTNPEKPTILLNTATNISQDSRLVTEVAALLPDETNIFKVEGRALNNKFIVYVNGIQLTEGFDWNPVFGYNGVFELIDSVIEPTKDIVMVTYITYEGNIEDVFNFSENYLNVDSSVVSSITTGVTSGVTALTVNYNNIQNRQEILLTKNILEGSSVIFSVNGVRLTENVEYFKSTTNSSKLILGLGYNITVGDSISIFYYTNNNGGFLELGSYRTLTPTIYWYVPDSYQNYLSSDGLFLVQVTTKNDTSFSNPIQAKYVDFNRVENSYNVLLDQLPTNLGENFLVRVYFFKDYHILFNNIVTTRAISEIAGFSVNTNYAENTY